jgi:hypothetical protein
MRRVRLLVWGLLVLVFVLVPVAFATGGGDDGEDRWLLGGSAQLAQDPENHANDVIKIDTRCTPPTFQNCFGTVSRKVNVKVDKLDNMLEFKSRFQGDLPTPKSCIGGSPRFQLAIDTDGDGVSNGNAFGYFGASPGFTGCPMETWLYEDLTGPGDLFITGGVLAPSPPEPASPPNEELEWDLTQFGGAFYNYWSQVEAFFAAHPNHLVCTVALVDDTFGAPAMSGIAHYDIISGGRATFEDRHDIAGRGFARGCGPTEDDDDDDDGDHDHDGDDDDDDDKFDDDRHERWGDDD